LRVLEADHARDLLRLNGTFIRGSGHEEMRCAEPPACSSPAPRGAHTLKIQSGSIPAVSSRTGLGTSITF
jgi:hypothetical protein